MKRHPVDSVSLVFALLFTAAVAWWGIAMLTADALHVPAAWIGAGTLLVVGLVGLVSALRPQRPATEDAPMTVPPTPPPALRPEPELYADYSDPFLAAEALPRVDGLLDADAVAAAYRDAGFDDQGFPSSPLRCAEPVTTATPPSERPAERDDPEDSTAELPARTRELPARTDRDSDPTP